MEEGKKENRNQVVTDRVPETRVLGFGSAMEQWV